MTKDIQEFNTITSCRHNAHICSDSDEYNDNINLILSEVKGIEESPGIELQLAATENFCSDECEDMDCIECRKSDKESVDTVKDENNSIIEKWLTECEELFNIDDLCPTGEARFRWMHSV